MKLKNLLMTVLAGAALLVSCQQKEELGAAAISVEPASLEFGTAADSKEVVLTATRDWLISGDVPAWMKLSATKGSASSKPQTLSLSVEANEGNNREADVVFTIGLAKATLHVKQTGKEGEYEVPQITCKEFIDKADANTEYRLVGEVTSNVNASYGSFDMNDGTATVVVWNVLNKDEWVDKIQKGGTVTVRGKYQRYENGSTVKHEMVEATIEAFVAGEQPTTGEAKGDGSKENPFNVAGAINAVKNLTWTDKDNYDKIGPFYVSGKISAIGEAYGKQFGNGTFSMVDEGFDSVFEAYRVLFLGNKKWVEGDTQIAVGDEVIICAELMNYRGNTPETVANSGYLYSLNGETGGEPVPGPDPEEGQPEGDGSLDNPFNVAAARAAVKDLTWTSNTDYQKVGPYYVKGKISKIANKGTYAESGEYGNATFDIVDEGFEASFAAYRILYLGNQKYTSGTDIKVGDEVIIYAELMNYRGNTPETVANSGYLYSLNGNTGGDTPGPGPDPQPGELEGDGTLENPYNAAAAIDAVKDLTWTSNTEYDKTDAVYVKGKISRIANKGTYTEAGDYGNASFYISADGEQANEFYCFRVLYLGNEKYTAGTDIKVGDDVIIYGALMNYKGNTPETVANECYLYSLNGVTEGEDPGPGPDPQPGDEVVVSFTKEQLAAAPGKGAVVKMDDVISFTNETDYGDNVPTELRVYKGKTWTVSAASGYAITKIEITCTKAGAVKEGPGAWGAGAPDGYTFEADGKNGTWTGNDYQVSFTATDNQVRIAALKVTYIAQ